MIASDAKGSKILMPNIISWECDFSEGANACKDGSTFKDEHGKMWIVRDGKWEEYGVHAGKGRGQSFSELYPFQRKDDIFSPVMGKKHSELTERDLK